MNHIKKLYKVICICVLVGTILCFKNSSVTVVTQASNINLNKSVNLNAMSKVIKNFSLNDINTPLDTYNGKLTAYLANCPECSGRLGCNGQNVLNGVTTYNDNMYGTVNIVASSSNLACGSIVRFKSYNSDDYITAIVLDRGVTGTTLDLLVNDMSTARSVGSRNITYDILRFGYNRYIA